MTDRLLVLVRHGQSDWNLKNLFTGWRDVDLTEKGVAEAREAGRKLKAQNQIRCRLYVGAQAGTAHARPDAHRIGSDNNSGVQGSGAHERDYGDLVGLNKDEARKKWGEEQVHIWRRSYDVAPPGGNPCAILPRASALLHPGNPAACAAWRSRSGVCARQLIARAGDGARQAHAGDDHQAQSGNRHTDDLPAQCRFDRGFEARSGGVTRPPPPSRLPNRASRVCG